MTDGISQLCLARAGCTYSQDGVTDPILTFFKYQINIDDRRKVSPDEIGVIKFRLGLRGGALEVDEDWILCPDIEELQELPRCPKVLIVFVFRVN